MWTFGAMHRDFRCEMTVQLSMPGAHGAADQLVSALPRRIDGLHITLSLTSGLRSCPLRYDNSTPARALQVRRMLSMCVTAVSVSRQPMSRIPNLIQ